MVLVGDVDVTSAVDEHVLCLRDKFVLGESAVAALRIGRDEIADLLRRCWARNVVDAQARVEISEINEITLFLDKGIVQQIILIVRAEAATLFAETLIRRIGRGQWQR